jgi:hypothetical protein
MRYQESFLFIGSSARKLNHKPEILPDKIKENTNSQRFTIPDPDFAEAMTRQTSPRQVPAAKNLEVLKFKT